jgi:uncharacterized protein
MLIGLLSDSHADASRLKKGISLLVQQGVDILVHCGDIVAEDHVAILADSGLPAYLVAGNMDRHAGRFAKEAKRRGVNFAADFLEVPLGEGEHLIAMHGDNEQLLCELVEGGQFPYVCHGHTHRTADKTFGSVRVICPGALTHPRCPKYPTVAVLDTDSGTVAFAEVV